MWQTQVPFLFRQALNFLPIICAICDDYPYLCTIMEKFELHILGSGSALPTTRHFPTSQVVNLRDKLFMIDCGEGAQLQFRKSRLKFSRLNRIFISHLHGDHCFGLLGLISTLNLLGRTADLHIHSPKGLEELLTPMLAFFNHQMTYKIFFHAFETKEAALIYEDRSLTVTTIPLRHRMPCCGFLFAEKPRLNHILRDMIDFYQVPGVRAEPYQERCGLRYAGRRGDTQCPSHPSLGCPAALCLLFGYDLSSFHNGTDKRSGFAFP